QLRAAARVLHRPPVRGGVVLLDRGDEGTTVHLGFVLGQPDGADLRAGEHRVRYEALVSADRRVGVQQVVLHDPGFEVGDVLQLPGAANVAERPDPLRAGVHRVVGDDEAEVVELHAGELDVELPAVRHSAGCDEQRIGLDGDRAGRRVDVEHDRV